MPFILARLAAAHPGEPDHPGPRCSAEFAQRASRAATTGPANGGTAGRVRPGPAGSGQRRPSRTASWTGRQRAAATCR
ncbi:hypothetical protein D7044_12170 [Micromonospora musae]|uniref:Uncharacterized protein n=1 Tax=Micromonospora musae TaxID=1894970 RepID=A0A3A9Y6S9_9ACTN|nr:hypothetical protein D7044_12170 [Micromonospora musae]